MLVLSRSFVRNDQKIMFNKNLITMKNLTSDELRQIKGGIDGVFLAQALAEIKRQMDAIEDLGNMTGTTDDIH